MQTSDTQQNLSAPSTSRSVNNTSPNPPPVLSSGDVDQQTGNVNPPGQGIGKELEPLSAPGFTADNSGSKTVEITASHPPEVIIPPDLKGAIEHGPDVKEASILRQARSIGIEPAKESTPLIIQTPTGTIKLPISYTEAALHEKKYPVSSSKRWLLALIKFLWRKYEPGIEKIKNRNN